MLLLKRMIWDLGFAAFAVVDRRPGPARLDHLVVYNYTTEDGGGGAECQRLVARLRQR